MTKYKKLKLKDGSTIDEHRYVMEQHLGRKLLHNEIVHHIDENKSNNNISNLQIMSKSEHSKLHQINNANRIKGVIKSNSKKILQLDLDNNIIKEWSSGISTKQEGFDNRCISACCLGKRKTHKGYKWKFK